MTSTVKIQSHNYPVRVEIYDRVWDNEKNDLRDEFTLTSSIILTPEDGEQPFYSTTTREIRVIDLDHEISSPK